MTYNFNNMTDFDRKQEKELEDKIQAFNLYQGNIERSTLDGEWTEEDLQDDLWGEVNNILKNWIDKNKFRAVYDEDLLKVDYMTEHIKDNYDLIEIYNTEKDKHRNDLDKKFGIHYFDDEIRKLILKELKNNLVGEKH